VARIGGNARGVVADLGSAEGHARLVDSEPHADIVVSNLGIFQPIDFFDTDDVTWDRHWQINVMAGVRLARAYLPRMAANRWGRFLFLGSESAFNIPVDMIHYGVSKTADAALARGLAKRMAGTGVTVNSVLPGPTLSEGVGAMLEAERVSSGKPIEEVAAAFVKAHRSTSIIQRAASVEEVANMFVYLASMQASATTGAALRVDGGVIDTLM
jgi:NAD(P)-dependent dehydrogenase (short-subunit alcohol dehydrogenase family)